MTKEVLNFRTYYNYFIWIEKTSVNCIFSIQPVNKILFMKSVASVYPDRRTRRSP